MTTHQQNIDPESPVFRCLDRRAEIEKTQRNLPHWFQVGAAIFVTFRTADSMPTEVVLRFQQELEHWLNRNGLPPNLAQGYAGAISSSQNKTNQNKTNQNKTGQCNTGQNKTGQCKTGGAKVAAIVPNCDPPKLQIPPSKRMQFRKLRARAWHRSLDECHGARLLKKPSLARIVAESLLYHDGVKYDLDSFIIMPNHVHAIVQFRSGGSLKTISQSWLRHTARQINFETGNKGEFWQSEPFDHIIRNGNQFEHLQSYIADNPKKAGLHDGEYLYWKRQKPK